MTKPIVPSFTARRAAWIAYLDDALRTALLFLSCRYVEWDMFSNHKKPGLRRWALKCKTEALIAYDKSTDRIYRKALNDQH